MSETKYFMKDGEYTHCLKGETEVVGIVQMPRNITASMIEDVIVTSFEGGSNHWIGHVDDFLADGSPMREGKPSDLPFSQWCTDLLLSGKEIVLVYDHDEKAVLTKDMLVNGFKLYWQQQNADFNFDGDADAGDADCVIQYAVFGKLVYG